MFQGWQFSQSRTATATDAIARAIPFQAMNAGNRMPRPLRPEVTLAGVEAACVLAASTKATDSTLQHFFLHCRRWTYGGLCELA